MKIVHTTASINVQHLKAFLENNLNAKFKEHRHLDTDLAFALNDKSIQITLPGLYEDFLFRIDVLGDDELHIVKSEHYTDDVNVLTIEEIMNNLLLDYPGRDNIDYVGEES